MSSITSDLTQTLSASDGFAICVKAVGGNLKRISFSILGLLDGIQSIEASGTSAKLTQLSNAKYLVTALFDGGATASMKVDSVSVPSTPLISKSYVVPGSVVEQGPSNTSDPQRAILLGLDEKLKVIAGSLSSPSLSDGKGEAEVAAMAVTHYEIALSDGEEIRTELITAAQAAAGHEFAVPNYVRYECVVQAKSSLGRSLASAPFEAKATNYPNKPDSITFLPATGGELNTDMRVRVPLPSDYIEWASNSSYLQGVTSDMIIENGAGTIHVKIYDHDGSLMSFEFERYEEIGEIWTMVVLVKDIALGRVVKLSHTVANSLGASENSDPSDPTLNMRLGLFPARGYMLTNYLASQGTVRVTPGTRATAMSTGFDESITVDAVSGVPVQLGNVKADREAFSQGSANLGAAVHHDGGVSVSTIVFLENITIQMMFNEQMIAGMPDPFGAYAEDAYVQYGALPHAAHPGGFNGPALPTTESRLSHDINSVAILLPDAGSDVKWRAASGNTTGIIYSHEYKTTGYGSVPIRPELECTSEFSEEGGKIKFKLHPESGAQYGLSGFKLKAKSTQTHDGTTTYVNKEYEISDIKAGATQLELGGLINGVATNVRGEMYADYEVQQIKAPAGLGLLLGFSGAGLKGELMSNNWPLQYMVKGEAACAIDEEADFANQINTEIKPFGKPDAPASFTLDISEKHDQELMAQVVFATNGSGRSYKRISIDAFDKNGEVYTLRKEDLGLSVTNDGRLNNEQSLHLTAGATLTRNGDNATYRIKVSNNLSTDDSDPKESNTVVPFGDGSYSVVMTGKKIERTFIANGRLITAEHVIGIDPNPTPGEAPLLQQMASPTLGQIGSRDSALNTATYTQTYTFSTSDDLSRYFAIASVEAGSVSPLSNFL